MEGQASTSKAGIRNEIPTTSCNTHGSALPGGSEKMNNSLNTSSTSKTLSTITQNDEKTRKLFLIIYKFLQQQMNENQNLNAVQKESLEVVVHCLGYAFQFFEFDFVEHSLQKIYDYFEKHKHDFRRKKVSKPLF